MDEAKPVDGSKSLRSLVAEVAAAYFASTHVGPADIQGVFSQIATSLASVGETPNAGKENARAEAARQTPTRNQIRRSVTPDALISFEDNKPYKTLRRHLAVRGLTPDEYRAKWGLPSDYPMVAPSYSAARSQLAKSLGLGQRGQMARDKGTRGGRARRSAPPSAQ